MFLKYLVVEKSVPDVPEIVWIFIAWSRLCNFSLKQFESFSVYACMFNFINFFLQISWEMFRNLDFLRVSRYALSTSAADLGRLHGNVPLPSHQWKSFFFFFFFPKNAAPEILPLPTMAWFGFSSAEALYVDWRNGWHLNYGNLIKYNSVIYDSL